MNEVARQPANSVKPTEKDFTVILHDSSTRIAPEWPSGDVSDEGFGRSFPFQTAAFLEVWEETYGRLPNVRLCLVEVRMGANLPVAFFPFQITRRSGIRVLGFADRGVADYNAPVLFPVAWKWSRATAQALWQAIVAALPAHDLAILDKMPEMVGGLINPLWLLSDQKNDVCAHGIDLTRPREEIDRSLPFRKTLLKRMRALEKCGDLRFVIAKDDAERTRLLEKLLEQKQRRFEETEVPGFESEPEKRQFFVLATERFAKTGMLFLSAITLNGDVLATLWGLLRNGHYVGLLTGNETGEWAKYSLGRIAQYRTLEWLVANGFTYMDLGVGDEPWKLEASDTTIPLRKWVIVRSYRARLFLVLQDALERLRATSFWQKLRPLKWRILRWRGRR